MTTKAGINPSIHGARGLLSAMIFVHHCCNSKLPTFDDPAIAWVQNAGGQALKMGVEMFFGISGLVILASLPRARSFTSFMWDRISRIYPVLWTTLFLIIALLATGISHRHFPAWTDLVLGFFTPPPFLPVTLIHPAAWSLGFEMSFYVLAGAAWFAGQRGFRPMSVGLVGLGVVLAFFYPVASLMLSGVIIARGLPMPRWIMGWSLFATLNFLLFLISWQAMDYRVDGLLRLNPVDLPVHEWLFLLPATLAMWLIGTVALMGLAAGYGPIGRLLRTPALQWLGSISYSFYLWHPIVMAVTKGLLQSKGAFIFAGQWSQPLLGIAAIGPTLLISHYSQIWLEIRATKWLRKHGPDGKHATVPIAPTIANG